MPKQNFLSSMKVRLGFGEPATGASAAMSLLSKSGKPVSIDELTLPDVDAVPGRSVPCGSKQLKISFSRSGSL